VSPTGKNPACSYSLIRAAITLDSPNTKAGGIRFNTLHSDKFTGVSINIGKILLATRLVSRSYLPLFTTPGIVNDIRSWVIHSRLNVLRFANFFYD
jgi:hypothetical protein